MDLPVYDIFIELNNPRTGLDGNSGVYNPAHEFTVMTFNGQQRTIKFNSQDLTREITGSFNSTMRFSDEDQTVYGVAIAADKQIYRNDNGEEFFVKFSKGAISDIIHDYSRKNNFNKFNIEHNQKKLEDGVYMVLSYQIDESKGLTAPKKFEDQTDGTWILGYKIVNTDVYNKFKDGTIQGFSVEGRFLMSESKFSSEDSIDKLNATLDELLSIIDEKLSA